MIRADKLIWLLVAAPLLFATSCGESTNTSGGSNDTGQQGDPQGQDIPPTQAALGGAGYTTFDDTQGGCQNSQNGINCNIYDSKDDVYMSGGPTGGGGLDDGCYYFAVIAPGSQNGGFVDGADGNLSDTTASNNGPGGGDLITNRTFHVTNQVIDAYPGCGSAGGHATGTSPNGKFIVQLSPYDDTPNNGGVYILAICEVGATSPSQCKYDAFKAPPSEGPPPPEERDVRGKKYYDSNANGTFDPGEGELGIAGWLIDIFDSDENYLTTLVTLDGVPDPDDLGRYIIPDAILDLGDFIICERQALDPWLQTGNVINQSIVVDATADLFFPEMCYDVHLNGPNSTVIGTHFGNICLGPGGGKTLGFWSNKNGKAQMEDDGSIQPELDLLNNLCLRNGDGSDFTATDHDNFRTWILGANAVNMAYMLSAQLAAMELNVEAEFVDGDSSVYAPGCGDKGSGNNFISISDLMSDANDSLCSDGMTFSGDPNRELQECLKDALDDANNNLNFVQPSQDDCPGPMFPEEPTFPFE